MPKKIFCFLVFLATVYLRNISNANQLNEKNVPYEIAFQNTEIPMGNAYRMALLLKFKKESEYNFSKETGQAIAMHQGHATHIP